jgi:uncharacterized membrane protein YhaH (DUF805 family)
MLSVATQEIHNNPTKGHTVFKRHFDFDGRLGRMSYFINFLKFNGIVFVLSLVVALFVILMPRGVVPVAAWWLLGIPAFFFFLYMCCHFGWSQGAKRAHDLGHSGWIQLIALVPFVGWLLSFYLFLAPGDEHSNLYGERESG